MGFVYKITNIRNNKSYIGISVNEPEKHRNQRPSFRAWQSDYRECR